MEGDILTKTKVRYNYRERDGLAITIYVIGILLAIINLWTYYNLQSNSNSISGEAVETAKGDLLFNEVLTQLTYKSKILENQIELCNNSEDIELKTNSDLFRDASNSFSKRDYSSSISYLDNMRIEINCSKSIKTLFYYESSAVTGRVVEKSASSIKVLFLLFIILVVIIIFRIIGKKSGFKPGDELEAEAKKGEIKLMEREY